MDSALLDTLVKLASLGASGVCIFSIFWVGWLLLRLPPDASPDRHKTLRFFMGLCGFVAVISAASGVANAMFNANTIADVRDEKQAVERAFETFRDGAQEQLRKFQVMQAKNREVAESLEIILAEKELLALEQRSDPQIQASIRTLRNSVSRLRGSD